MFWYDEELNAHWYSAPGSAEAFGLAVRVVAELAGAGVVTCDVTAPAPSSIEGPPQLAAASMHALWRRESILDSALRAGEDVYAFSAQSEGGGGQLSLGSRKAVFGDRYDDVVTIMRRFADERQIRIIAPLQDTTFVPGTL